MIERLADATVRSEVWKEYDRGCLTDEEILQRFVANDPEIETEIRKALDDFHGLVTKYDYAIPWVKELKAEASRFWSSPISHRRPCGNAGMGWIFCLCGRRHPFLSG